ncbi:MAG: bifunctional pyr operon transcriptional regulator/uracil phosphoribosyltransferase PyrR [Planctomycetes bacterium]|nr:bifunctional pyr operon transcriptional regulator/uracil phosphoribosyltransferase PyrR [Planctomycetota bacterium]
MTERVLQQRQAIDTEIRRLAAEILAGAEPPALIGIRTHGVTVAKRLADAIEAAGRPRPELGAIDITLYRDDLAGRALPQVHGSEIAFDIEGRRVVLVDDVLFTGRTVRAALTELADYGRPRRIELCVLVDRGHREVPICADYTGFRVETSPEQRITVRLSDPASDTDAVVLVERKA